MLKECGDGEGSGDQEAGIKRESGLEHAQEQTVAQQADKQVGVSKRQVAPAKNEFGNIAEIDGQ